MLPQKVSAPAASATNKAAAMTPSTTGCLGNMREGHARPALDSLTSTV
jgi:hypothetical protein